MQVDQQPPVKKIHLDLPQVSKPTVLAKEDQPLTNGSAAVEKRKKPEVRKEPEVPPKGIFCSPIFDRPNKGKFEPPKMVKERLVQNLLDKVTCLHSVNERRCNACPLYGKDLMESVTVLQPLTVKPLTQIIQAYSQENTVYDLFNLTFEKVTDLLPKMNLFMNKFQMVVHKVLAVPKSFEVHCEPIETMDDPESVKVRQMMVMPLLQTPETRLIQYDCGKLQVLVRKIWRREI